MKPRTKWVVRSLRLAAVSALIALGLMVWGVLDPRPIALVVAMSVGQALGTLSFALYAVAVIADLLRAHVFSGVTGRFSSTPPENTPSKPS